MAQYNATALIVDDRDPTIVYSPGWVKASTTAEYHFTKSGATGAGMSATFSFSGTGVEVYGSLASADVDGLPTTTYQIDGILVGEYQAQDVLPPGAYTSKSLFFRSPLLTNTDHQLLIVNMNGTAPNTFWLDYIVYTPQWLAQTSLSPGQSLVPFSTGTAATHSITSTPTISTSTTSQLSTPSSVSATSAPHDRGRSAVIGAVCGGVVLLLGILIIAIVLMMRHRDELSAKSTFFRKLFSERVSPFGSWRFHVDTETNMQHSEKESNNAASTTHLVNKSDASTAPSVPPSIADDTSLPQPSSSQPSRSRSIRQILRRVRLTPVVKHHQDSGIRLSPSSFNPVVERPVLEIPPAYSQA